MNLSDISWTDLTWNVLAGCTPDSAGCDSCWAMSTANIRTNNPHPDVAAAYAGTVGRDARGRTKWSGLVRTLPNRLGQPFKLSRARRLKIFVCSMSDLFHPLVPASFIARVVAVIATCPHHDFQVLTKRAGRMRALFAGGAARLIAAAHAAGDAETVEILRDTPWPLTNLWAGVSVENDDTKPVRRVWHLTHTEAAYRWVSAEPLIGPVDFTELPTSHRRDGWRLYLDALCGRLFDVDRQPVDLPGHTLHRLDWIVVGGESGPLRDTDRQRAARPMALQWAENIVAQTHGHQARVHIKQLGRVLAHEMGVRGDGKKLDDLPGHLRIREFPTLIGV